MDRRRNSRAHEPRATRERAWRRCVLDGQASRGARRFSDGDLHPDRREACQGAPLPASSGAPMSARKKLERLTPSILAKAESKGKAAGWHKLICDGYSPAEIAIYAEPVLFANDVVQRVRAYAETNHLPVPLSCAPPGAGRLPAVRRYRRAVMTGDRSGCPSPPRAGCSSHSPGRLGKRRARRPR